jgi:hypothetical protein
MSEFFNTGPSGSRPAAFEVPTVLATFHPADLAPGVASSRGQVSEFFTAAKSLVQR